jgi:hypothetical protein
MYVAKWVYDMRMPVGCMNVAKRGCSWLKADQRGCKFSKGVDCDILAQGFNRIDRILIPPRYDFFPEAQLQRTLGLSVLGPNQFQNG